MANRKRCSGYCDHLGGDEKFLLCLLAIFAVGFLARMAYTANSPYLVKGIDGPYYISQVDYLVETGRLLHKDSPLAFYYLLCWRLLLGDTVKALKIAMSVITGLMCVPMLFLVRRITGDNAAAILSAFVSVFNPYLFTMTYNLYKNEIGMLLLLAFFALFFRFVSTEGVRRKWKSLVILTLVFLALWGTHIMATGMAVLFTISYLIVAIFADRTAAKRALRMLGVVVGLGGCGLLVLAAAFPAAFWKAYKLGLVADLIEDESEAPRFAPPQQWSAQPWIEFLLSNLDPVRWFGLPAIVGLVAFVQKLQKRQLLPGEAFLVSTYSSWLIFVGPAISRDLVWRFALASFVPISMMVGYGLAAIRSRIPGPLAMPILALVLGLSFIEASAAAGRSRTTITEAEYLELLEMRKVVPEKCAIVGMVGEAYWYEAVLHKRIVRSTYIEEEDYAREPLLFIAKRRTMPPEQRPPPAPGPGQPPPPFPGPERLGNLAKLIFNGRFFAAYLLPPRTAPSA